MTGQRGLLIRRMAGAVGALVALALIAAPVALASGDTITARRRASSSTACGRRRPKCADATRITINWGQGTPTTPQAPSTAAGGVSRHTHVHGSGHVHRLDQLRGGLRTALPACRTTFTANVERGAGSSPSARQVGVDVGCQFLIDVTPGGTTVLQDTTQGPYEGSEDALDRRQERLPRPRSPRSRSPRPGRTRSASTATVCAITAPDRCRPAACRSARADTAVRSDQRDRRAPSRRRPDSRRRIPTRTPVAPRTGTRGRRTTTRTSRPTSARERSSSRRRSNQGTRRTSASRSLPAPPRSTSARRPSARPSHGAPTVTATGASFSGIVDPNGSATTVSFQYGLDLKYSKPGASGPNYTN